MKWATCFDGFDINSAYPLPTPQNFKCLVTAYNATRAGVVISNNAGTLNLNAQAAINMTTTTLGLRTAAMIQFCATKDAAGQINSFLGGLSPELYERAWIFISSLSYTGCEWTSKTLA